MIITQVLIVLSFTCLCTPQYLELNTLRLLAYLKVIVMNIWSILKILNTHFGKTDLLNFKKKKKTGIKLSFLG